MTKYHKSMFLYDNCKKIIFSNVYAPKPPIMTNKSIFAEPTVIAY